MPLRKTRSTNTPTPSNPRQRLFRLLLSGAALLCAGLLYAVFYLTFGWGIPCPFYTFTGLQCPGCGVSRLCLSLLQGDILAAWGFNPGLMAAAPFLAVLFGASAVRYVKTGSLRNARWQSIGLWAVCAWLLLWGVWRNIA